MMIKKLSMIISQGVAAFTTSHNGIPVTPEVTNRFKPTGGVIMPISMFTVMMMPKWIGSMPSWVAIGKKIGARISRIDDGSVSYTHLDVYKRQMWRGVRNWPLRPAVLSLLSRYS